MADDWDDWGDDDDKSVTGDASNCSEKSEGWDWPGTSAEKDSATAATTAERVAPNDPDSKSTRLAEAEEREAREEAVGEMAENYFAELQRYLEDLADPSVREEINQALTKRDYASLCRYYDGRDDLVAYTLDTELTRLAYFVVTEDGRRLGGAAGAVAAAAGREEGRTEGVGQGGEGGGEEGGGSEGAVCNFLRGRRDGVMLRMANQSIFADMLEAIQGRLLRPDLETSVISRDCDFFLDFSRGVLEANSLFEVSTVGGGGPGAQETLVIAQIKGTVLVETRTQTCSQRLLSPQLRMVFDDAMHASARVLALHSFMDGGEAGGTGVGSSGSGGSGGGGGGSLQRMGSLRASLARASTDGMGRAAAAGTGLLANVVAGVGTAIGASRTGTDEDLFYGGGGSGGDTGRRRRTSRTKSDDGCLETAGGGASVVQLYRRADPDDGGTERVAGGAVVAPPNAARSDGRYDGSGSSSRRGAEIGSQWGSGSTSSGAAAEVAVVPGPSPRASGNSGDNNNTPHAGRRGGDLTGDTAGGGDGGGTERRSAVGMASATGGAVLRGLWGGVQMAAAAGMAVAAQGSIGGGDGEAAVDGSGCGREGEPSPAFRLYRRDEDDSS